MVTWQRTSLSTDPAYIEMGHLDRRGLGIDAGETVTDADAVIVDFNDRFTPLTEIIEDVVVNGDDDGAVVIVSGLTEGVLYRLSTVFTPSDGEVWTKTTFINCVA